jgi:hypothetical protein
MNNNLTETQAEYFYDLNNPDSRKKKTWVLNYGI